MKLKELYHVAVPTAFDENEALNIQATLAHIHYLKEKGVNSVLVCGSTGEQHSLTLAEKLQLLAAIENDPLFDSDFELIFGVSSIRQKEAEHLMKEVEKNKGVKGILLGFPPYVLPTQKEALIYAKTLCSFTYKSVILYNNPKRTGFDLEKESFLQLSVLPNVVGIKEAGARANIPYFLKHSSKDLLIYAGGENELADKLAIGFNRLSSISGNLYPKEIRNWFFSLLNKEEVADEQIRKRMEKIFKDNPLPFIKQEISKKTGINMGTCRKPIGN